MLKIMSTDYNKYLLRWYVDAGVTESTEEVARNRLNTTAAVEQISENTKNKTIETCAGNEISKNINNCHTLKELKEVLIAFEGSSLKQSAKNLVFGDGNSNANLMIVGEAPGAEEDLSGKPFVGASGQLLQKMLVAINIKRSDCYITNLLPWRPPGNRKPTTAEVQTFLPFIARQIEIISPILIVLVGGSAANALYKSEEGITKLRGKIIKYKNINSIPIYHPAYLLRQPNLKRQAWQDLLAIEKILDKSRVKL